MRTRILLCLVTLLPCSWIIAQVEEDPLAETYIIQNGGGDELVTMDGGEQMDITIYKYFKAHERYASDTLVWAMNYGGSSCYGGEYDMDLADLDHDGYKEIVAAWSSEGRIDVVVLKADPARLNVDEANAWSRTVPWSKTSPSLYEPQHWNVSPGIFVTAGNLDPDSLGEFVVAWWADDGMIEITAYDVDDTLQVTELATIRDQEISEPPGINLCEDYTYLWNIECADFNGDGTDEILLTGRVDYEPEGWQVIARIYTYDENSGHLEPMAGDVLFTQADPAYDIGDFNMATGHFHSTGADDGIIGILQYNADSAIAYATEIIANTLIPFSVDDQLSIITAGEPIYQRQDTIPAECYYSRNSTLRGADVNHDGLDELFSSFSFDGKFPIFKIYQGDQSTGFSVYADLDDLSEKFYGAMAIGDFHKDTMDGPGPLEIILSTKVDWYPEPRIYQLQTNQDGSFERLSLIKADVVNNWNIVYGKTETSLADNFDRDIRIGKPKRYAVTEILQPLVILNAPPIHFDVFDGQSYDLCRSYNENESEFIAKYIKETQQSTEVRTEVNRDWSLSKSISGGFSAWGVSVSAYLSETYGEKFSKVAGSSRTVTVGFEIDATVDDQIYAMVMDYDLWEYPVYGNDNVEGHILVVDPKIVKNSWFDSKSWKGYSYIPIHEVGNIMSYRRYPLLSDNPQLIEKIKGDYGLETSFLLSGNSSYDWFLNFTDFTENQATTTKEYNRDWGFSVSYWGSGFSMDGSYHSENIRTQRTTVESGIDLDVHLDAVDMSLGETRYEVTPYAYWASSGALVIDYAVAPEVAGPGGEDTWWDTHYGYLPDPAFILPWRYDPEKGYAISDIKRYQTNDILFRPEDPAGGDTITIHAQVHNFSLLPTPGPIGVRFYVGDPDNGGTLITGTDGTSEVLTAGVIPARGRKEVEMRWIIPEALGAFPRIYAEIDADNTLTEIHENNNKSWNILQKTTGEPSADEEVEHFRVDVAPGHIYPNPFSHFTRIRLDLPETRYVTIQVFNAFGQKIGTLVNEPMTTGSHEVEFNAADLPSGIYFCRIAAGEFRQVLKMVVSR